LIAHSSAKPEAAAFADALKARYLDGADAFSGLNEAQIRESWFKYDPHWNQQGHPVLCTGLPYLSRNPREDGVTRRNAPKRGSLKRTIFGAF
jgi:hypothetical protein